MNEMSESAQEEALRDEVAALLAAAGLELGPSPVEPLGGVGLMGRVVRAHSRESGPAIAKLPSTDPQNHGVALGFGYYEREAAFYRQVSPLLGDLVPNCLAIVDHPDGSVSLLLEDRSDLPTADQLAGASVTQARQAIEVMAAIHARTWDHGDLASWDLPNPLDSRVAAFGPLFDLTWPGFVDAFGDLVSAEIEAKAHRLMSGYDAACARLASAPNCLVHGDFRLDNLLLGAEETVVVDWQLASTGTGAYDLCRFLVGSLTSANNEAHSSDLIDHYLERLHNAGLTQVHRDELLEDLQSAFVTYLPIPVTVAVGIDSLDDRGERLKRTLASRLCAAIDRHDLP
jgi:hypothetical protein